MRLASIIEALRKSRATYGRVARAEKLRLIREINRMPIEEPTHIRAYHDVLMFLSAYPDNVELLGMVKFELDRIAKIVQQWNKKRSLDDRLADTGIANTELVCSFSLETTEWLVRRLPNDVGIDWKDDRLVERLDKFLHSIVPSVERDGLYADHLSTKEWFDLAKGDESTNAAQWLVEQFRRLKCPPVVRDHAFDPLNLELRWRLRKNGFSRTTARFPRRMIFFQREPIQRQLDLKSLVVPRLRLPSYLPAHRADVLLDACRSTLCVRRRETDPLTYANPQEVSLFRLDRGIDVAVFGMSPDRRLPIESYFGFVVARNRVPIGYGGGWVFFERCEIGVNIFDEFRGGESAFAFAKVIHLYRRYFKTTRFLVDPFQFGADNREAIQSGAFWFYYRLGFRPIDAKLQVLADEQSKKLLANPRHRTPAVILRKLARAKLGIAFGNDLKKPLPNLDLTQIGLAITGFLGQQFHGDRELAESSCLLEAMRVLRTGNISKWPADEQHAFKQLALLLAPLNEIDRWPRSTKTRLLQALRAKGGARERDYVLVLQAVPEFRNALVNLARSAPSPI